MIRKENVIGLAVKLLDGSQRNNHVVVVKSASKIKLEFMLNAATPKDQLITYRGFELNLRYRRISELLLFGDISMFTAESAFSTRTWW